MNGKTPEHEPALSDELIEQLDIDVSGCYVDATYGRGGHSRAVLDILSDKGRLIAFDKDPEACADAESRFGNDRRFEIRHASFRKMGALLDEGWGGKVAGIFFDLGVSLPQLKQARRGFSHTDNGPLDMRMDSTTGPSVAEWLNRASQGEIRRVIGTYGEEPRAALIAATITKAISGGVPVLYTRDLANLIASVSNVHNVKSSTTRVFLAFRLFINRELDDLKDALSHVVALLRRGGRFIAIAFHSLEDRIVKHFIRDNSTHPPSVRGLPPATDVVLPLKKVGKVLYPDAAEVARNPRVRSARMRVAEKV